ncbi:hypothetical protein IJI55_01535 [Candidatus Saccharibacteria bacterium]|nr:hypothetical protein [Candidatus Saccharibacteria bacterium]MBR3323317.1 hypothetical protein [Candidatus Saccharibacteria bacterium]
MILYKKHQNEFLMPVFMGVFMVLLNLVPFTAYLNTKSTNTDSLPSVNASQNIEKIALPDKTEVNKIDVPTLGGVSSNYTVNTTKQKSVQNVSVCANTPTPGYNQISVCGRVISLYYSDNYANDSPVAGMAVKYTVSNFIYGHNSYDVFGGLHSVLQPGDPIIVNMNGITETYYFNSYWLNTTTNGKGQPIVDPKIRQPNGSGSLGIMTCAPWVTNGANDTSRFDFLFTK